MARPAATRLQSRRPGIPHVCKQGREDRAPRVGPRPATPVRDLLAVLRRSARHAATGRKMSVPLGRQTRHLFSRDRMIACYVAHVRAGISLRAIAGATGRHPSTIASVVRLVEGCRDDAGFDRLVADVEHVALGGQAGEIGHG